MENRIKLKVLGITYSQIQQGAYALVLSEENGSRRIPIIIGTAEAQSIAIQLEHLTPPRPLTHDLFVSFANAFDIKLKEVYIYKFEEGVFSSELLFEDNDGKEKKIDSRTSDAIAFALRSGAGIYTNEEIIKLAGVEFDEDTQKENSQIEKTEFRSVDELQKMLNQAISDEDYEMASQLRDEIRKIKEFESGKDDSSLK
ncbi:MAG: bifunctional nuclease family protein [Bacteroidales bacterium]|nr:bifunctional nuclease family protein [Bacteroidales bacterium]